MRQDLEYLKKWTLAQLDNHSMDSLTFQSIYSYLLDGKRITLAFATAEEAENFRIKMAKYKTAQEELCTIVDMKVGSENKVFSSRQIQSIHAYNFQFQFRERPAETRYEVIAVETPAEV